MLSKLNKLKEKFVEKYKDYQLCYVEGNFAYFTDNFDIQSGDDWDDAPYECNAGTPSTHLTDVIKIAFDCSNLYTPADVHHEPISVNDINNGKYPWLTSYPWKTNNNTNIYGGDYIKDFIKKIEKEDGKIYINLNDIG